MPIVLLNPGCPPPPLPKGIHWAEALPNQWQIQKSLWKDADPNHYARFTASMHALADAWRAMPAWNKNKLSDLSANNPFGRPDRQVIRRHSWRAFISSCFAIPYFDSDSAYTLDQTSERWLIAPPTITANHETQEAQVIYTFFDAQPPDTTTFVSVFMLSPRTKRPSARWRNARILRTQDTVFGQGLTYILNEPTPWTFAEGDPLTFFFRLRSQNQQLANYIIEVTAQ